MKEFWLNEYWLLAFVFTPAIVVALGWGAAFLHLYQSRRRHLLHPGNPPAGLTDLLLGWKIRLAVPHLIHEGDAAIAA